MVLLPAWLSCSAVWPFSVSKRGLQIPMNIFEDQVKINIIYAVVFDCSTFNKYLTGLVIYMSIHLAFVRKCAHSSFFWV